MSDSTIDLSVVIPVYNEEENLEPLVNEIHDEIKSLNYEILFIDDGSTDSSVAKLNQMKENDDTIRVIQHNRNFGKAIAWQPDSTMHKAMYPLPWTEISKMTRLKFQDF